MLVASYIAIINKQTNLNKPSNKLKLFKMYFDQKWLSFINLYVMNKWSNVIIKYSFLQKKRPEKGKWIHHLSTHYTGQWILL